MIVFSTSILLSFPGGRRLYKISFLIGCSLQVEHVSSFYNSESHANRFKPSVYFVIYNKETSKDISEVQWL